MTCLLLVFFLCTTLNNVQGLLMYLCSRITRAKAGGTICGSKDQTHIIYVYAKCPDCCDSMWQFQMEYLAAKFSFFSFELLFSHCLGF